MHLNILYGIRPVITEGQVGATYTSIASEILHKLNVEKVRKVNIEFANGKVEQRYVGDVYIKVESIKVPNQIIFAEKDDASVLGLVTLESCGLTVDTINRKLVPLPKIHHYQNFLNLT